MAKSRLQARVAKQAVNQGNFSAQDLAVIQDIIILEFNRPEAFDCKKAIEVLTPLYKKYQNFSLTQPYRVAITLAEYNFRVGNKQKSLEILLNIKEQISKLSREHQVAVLNKLAGFYIEEKQIQQAEQLLLTALKINADDYKANLALGDIYLQRAKKVEREASQYIVRAELHYNKAWRLHQYRDFSLLFKIHQTLSLQENFNKAEALLHEAMHTRELKPYLSRIYWLTHFNCYKKNDTRGAFEYALKAYELVVVEPELENTSISQFDIKISTISYIIQNTPEPEVIKYINAGFSLLEEALSKKMDSNDLTCSLTITLTDYLYDKEEYDRILHFLADANNVPLVMTRILCKIKMNRMGEAINEIIVLLQNPETKKEMNPPIKNLILEALLTLNDSRLFKLFLDNYDLTDICNISNLLLAKMYVAEGDVQNGLTYFMKARELGEDLEVSDYNLLTYLCIFTDQLPKLAIINQEIERLKKVDVEDVPSEGAVVEEHAATPVIGEEAAPAFISPKVEDVQHIDKAAIQSKVQRQSRQSLTRERDNLAKENFQRRRNVRLPATPEPDDQLYQIRVGTSPESEKTNPLGWIPKVVKERIPVELASKFERLLIEGKVVGKYNKQGIKQRGDKEVEVKVLGRDGDARLIGSWVGYLNGQKRGFYRFGTYTTHSH